MPGLLDLVNLQRPASYTNETEWAQAALNSLAREVNPSLWSQVNGIADPIARLSALEPLMFRVDNQVYDAFKSRNPRPAPTPAAVETPTTPAPVVPEPIDPAKMAMARERALHRAELNLRAQGIDPAQYLPLINAEYDKLAGTASLEKDPYSVFSDDIATNVVKAQQATSRNQFMGQYDQSFGDAADAQQLPSSLLDDAISSILAEQRGSAEQFLERGKARGIYNDVGYNAGRSALDTAMGVGRSDLSLLGTSLIDQYRGRADEIGDRAFNAYQSYAPTGGTFDLSPYISEFNDFAGRTRANAAGDLRGILGGKNYFDFSGIANASGAAQGALNLRDTDVATALNERKRQNTLSRGLGSQGGAF